jgi:hypothetical protein
MPLLGADEPPDIGISEAEVRQIAEDAAEEARQEAEAAAEQALEEAEAAAAQAAVTAERKAEREAMYACMGIGGTWFASTCNYPEEEVSPPEVSTPEISIPKVSRPPATDCFIDGGDWDPITERCFLD